ncbi:MAG: rane-associated lipoprotein involved in thiamine biosynthesis, partial [Mycobacterium sp.]|nr:rane-associated lipoprotein involved in thiamine biosynthesis [Mycobacterium sp.]
MILGAPDIAHSRWQRWTTDMQIIVHDAASLPLARREVDAELDAIEAAASRFRPDSEIMALAASAGRPIE